MTHLAPICFYKQTTLRTETFTLNNLSAQIPLHCYTQRFVHRLTLTRRRLYTQMLLRKKLPVFCTKMPLRNKKGTQALLHTGPFTQRNFCTEQLLHKKITQKNVDTEKRVHRDCTKNLHTETFTCRNFTQNNFYTKKIRTETFVHCSFYTDVFTHRCPYTKNLSHTETCAHNTLLHTTIFCTERLCFPFLIA